MPAFSIVIPTLRRADTLRHALATAAAQDFADCEIVVQSNGGDPAIERVVREVGDSRIRLFATADVVPMSQNWEIALGNVRGDYLTFIGDDDGLLPDACSIAARALAASKAEIVSWLPFLYYWPDYPEPGRRNRLLAHVDTAFRMLRFDSRHALQEAFCFRLDYSRLPMVYNSFVARSLVERVRARIGRYFAGRSPDVVSGAVNAAVSGSFIRLTRPLSVAGLSRHSTGHNTFVHARAPRDHPTFARDFGTFALDPRLAGSMNLQAMNANDFLEVQSLLLADDAGIAIDFRGLLAAMARTINDTRGAYEATLGAMRAIAAHSGIDLAGISIPDRVDTVPALAAGVTPTGARTTRHVVDGDAERLRTIQDAVQFARRLIPPIETLDPVVHDALDDRGGTAVPADGVLTFDSNGNGVPALCDGWSEPEAWGTWAVESPAVLRIAAQTPPPRRCVVELACRACLHGATDRVTVSCHGGGKRLGEWLFTDGITRKQVRVEVPVSAWTADRMLSLELAVDRLRSPAQLGVSADTRLLGVGVEWMRIIDDPAP